jgi:hypothetical protein
MQFEKEMPFLRKIIHKKKERNKERRKETPVMTIGHVLLRVPYGSSPIEAVLYTVRLFYILQAANNDATNQGLS